MQELANLALILLGFVVVAVCILVYLKILAFLKEGGWSLGRFDASHEPSKVEIQTLFQGNTKDEDQI